MIFSDDNRSITLDSTNISNYTSTYDLNEYKHGAAFYFKVGSSDALQSNKWWGIGFSDANLTNTMPQTDIDYGFEFTGANWISIYEGSSVQS